MLRLNPTYEHVEAMSVKMDDEFKTIENVIMAIFEILDEYEELLVSTKLYSNNPSNIVVSN